MSFETSTDTAILDAAMAKAQGEIQPALKDSTNPHFQSKYADIASVWNSARAALSKHGISVTQWPLNSNDGKLTITTRLACAGQWLKATFAIPVMKQDAQGYGSATTYARRFTLMAALGIAPDDDDDGNNANTKPPQEHRKPAPKPSGKPAVAPKSVATKANLANPDLATKEDGAWVQKLGTDHGWSMEDIRLVLSEKFDSIKVTGALTKQQLHDLGEILITRKPAEYIDELVMTEPKGGLGSTQEESTK